MKLQSSGTSANVLSPKLSKYVNNTIQLSPWGGGGEEWTWHCTAFVNQTRRWTRMELHAELELFCKCMGGKVKVTVNWIWFAWARALRRIWTWVLKCLVTQGSWSMITKKLSPSELAFRIYATQMQNSHQMHILANHAPLNPSPASQSNALLPKVNLSLLLFSPIELDLSLCNRKSDFLFSIYTLTAERSPDVAGNGRAQKKTIIRHMEQTICFNAFNFSLNLSQCKVPCY